MKRQVFSSREKNYIICVDDEKAILNQLAIQLEEAFGELCVIEYAESAEEALAVMEDIKQGGGAILVVISDQVMPGMQGDQFLEIVNRRFRGTRKVLLTGYAGLDSAMYAINQADLDKYLEKPWDREVFLATIQHLLGPTVKTTVPKGTFRMKEAVRNVQIFRDLPLGVVSSIAKKLKLVMFPKDSTIFSIDDPGDRMYVIKSGEVKVIAGLNENDEILAYLGRGNYFGEMALLTGEPRSASVITSMESELYMLTKSDFDFLLKQHPSIALTLSHVLSQRLRDVSIKKAGRQNKIICIFNTLQEEHEQEIVTEIARNLLKETNGNVVVIERDSSEAQRPFLDKVESGTMNASWLIENLDNIQESELSAILHGDEEGVKFFLLPEEEKLGLSSYVTPLLGVLKAYYNFVLIHIKVDAEPDDNILKVMEQANTVLYLMKQAESTDGKIETLLQGFRENDAQLLKKFEIVVVHQAPDLSFLESLAGFVERHRIHFLRIGESVRSLFNTERPIQKPVGNDASISQARRDVSRIARRLGNVSVGLVLGGGGARAYAHLGILQVLHEEGIPIDIVAGTSMGAFIGALYVMGKTVDEILELSHEYWQKLNSPMSWTLPRIAFIKGKRIRNLVHDIFGDVLIEDLPLPFFCVAGDLVSGQEVVLGSGKLYEAILATGALPGFFEPVPRKNMYLVDGGVVNNVPGDLLKKQGVDMVIAVDVTPEREVYLTPAEEMTTGTPGKQNVFLGMLRPLKRLKSSFGPVLLPRIIMRVIAIEGLEITRTKARYFDIHIKPNLEDFDLFDFSHLREIVNIGEQTGRQEIDKIRETIASLKR